MQRMNHLPQFGFLFEKMPAIVESLPWHAPQVGEEPQEPYGYLSNWEFCSRCRFRSFIPSTKNMHFHGIKKDNSLARVAVGCYLRPSVCDFCSLPAEAAEEEKAKAAVCEACRLSKPGKASACVKEDEEHTSYRANEGMAEDPPPMPEGIYPGWKTRIITGEAKTDKHWYLECPGCGGYSDVDRPEKAALWMARHMARCTTFPDSWRFGLPAPGPNDPPLPVGHLVGHLERIKAEYQDSNKYFALTREVAMQGHTALAKAILNKEVTLEDVPVGAAGAWMDAIRALEAKLTGVPLEGAPAKSGKGSGRGSGGGRGRGRGRGSGGAAAASADGDAGAAAGGGEAGGAARTGVGRRGGGLVGRTSIKRKVDPCLQGSTAPPVLVAAAPTSADGASAAGAGGSWPTYGATTTRHAAQALGITPGGGDNGNIAALLSQKPPEELAAEREAKRKRYAEHWKTWQQKARLPPKLGPDGQPLQLSAAAAAIGQPPHENNENKDPKKHQELQHGQGQQKEGVADAKQQHPPQPPQQQALAPAETNKKVVKLEMQGAVDVRMSPPAVKQEPPQEGHQQQQEQQQQGSGVQQQHQGSVVLQQQQGAADVVMQEQGRRMEGGQEQQQQQEVGARQPVVDGTPHGSGQEGQQQRQETQARGQAATGAGANNSGGDGAGPAGPQAMQVDSVVVGGL